MTSKLLAELLLDLGVPRSHSRPSVSNENPYSEAQFKTMKYGPSYPERFGSLEEAQAWVSSFIRWYNTEHRHLCALSPIADASIEFGDGDDGQKERYWQVIDVVNRFRSSAQIIN
jgi:putative transposase